MWLSGSTTRITTMTAAPMTCHHTEMLFISAIRWPPKMFKEAVRASTTKNIQNTRVREYPSAQDDESEENERSKKVAQP